MSVREKLFVFFLYFVFVLFYVIMVGEGDQPLLKRKGFVFMFVFFCICVLQSCINCAILLSGLGARGVSSEHMENMEMFSCSPT